MASTAPGADDVRSRTFPFPRGRVMHRTLALLLLLLLALPAAGEEKPPAKPAAVPPTLTETSTSRTPPTA